MTESLPIIAITKSPMSQAQLRKGDALNIMHVPRNPKMDDFVDDNSRISFCQLILILDELHKIVAILICEQGH
ncbi:hypothetical protein CFP56_043810 [Quercus suber]|uniref:Uncharacterized protein n=1 Tax=Quercus suber TaxID=58331 RepID=A0AAW0LII0_QUESU